MDEQMERIDRILGKSRAPLATWHQYLSTNLAFPVQGEVFEHRDCGPYRDGDRVSILG